VATVVFLSLTLTQSLVDSSHYFAKAKQRKNPSTMSEILDHPLAVPLLIVVFVIVARLVAYERTPRTQEEIDRDTDEQAW
jgi:hypothetical protein